MLGFVLNVLIHGLNQKTIFIRIFRVLHTVQFSRNCFSLFLCFRSNSFILSNQVRFVKNFFNLFSKKFSLQVKSAEGGIWTLAPLLTTYSLSRGAPSTTWVLLLGWSFNLYSVQDKSQCLSQAERVGFEPTRPFGQTVFKTGSLNHSDTSPQ